MRKDRCFITVATGEEKYYQLAANLCVSYKKRGNGQYPFVLVCDRENDYTTVFDHVIVTEEVRRSTIDKLLMRLSPCNETIFLDADTLVIDGIDDLWDIFADQDDVSAFGCILPLDSKKGWFTYEGSGAYKDRIKFLISMNGGVYYVRKSAVSEKVFRDALQIVDDYSDIDFKYFSQPQDEPVMAMAMVINNCKPVDIAYDMIVLPFAREKITVDFQGNVYEGKKRTVKKMLHFATANTRLFLYNYLNDRIQKEPDGPTMLDYWRMRLQYAPRELKSRLKHDGGALLRKLGMDNVVDYLKSKRR